MRPTDQGVGGVGGQRFAQPVDNFGRLSEPAHCTQGAVCIEIPPVMPGVRRLRARAVSFQRIRTVGVAEPTRHFGGAPGERSSPVCGHDEPCSC